MSDNLINLTIDGHEVSVPQGSTIMKAAEKLSIEIPHFCYHERLSVAGNCRMCLVNIEGAPKPVTSCSWPVSEGMKVTTSCDDTKEARKGVMEFLLINHPLDCPICDQAGECDLQDVAVSYGSDRSHYCESKRSVDDLEIGSKIKTVMTRCIHCTRCIRFATEVAGVEEMGATGRGENMRVGTYVEQALQSELAGNMIDLCPVGALTSKPYAFTARAWELVRTPSIDVMDAVGTNIRVDSRAGEVMRIVPRENAEVNEEWMSDTARFSYDGLARNRLTTPMHKVSGKWKSITWPKAFDVIAKAHKGVDVDRIAGLAGDIHSLEDLYAFNDFMKDVIGTDNVDGRMDGYTLNREDGLGASLMNTGIAGLEKADAFVLIGTNPRLEAPLINTRIRKQALKGAPVIMVGEDADLTYTSTHAGVDIKVLEGLAKPATKLGKLLKGKENIAVIVGAKAVLTRTDARPQMREILSFCEKMNVARKDWNGFNVLHQQAGRAGALALGITPEDNGMDASAIYKALKGGKIDVLWQFGEGDTGGESLSGAKFSIYMGTHKTEAAKEANLMLPLAAYTEKDGLWMNTEGRVQEATAASKPPLNAKEDWKVFRALSDVFKSTLPFNTLKALRENMIEDWPILAEEHWGAKQEFDIAFKAGKATVTDTAYTAPVDSFYLSNEILRASPVMAECAAENGAAKFKPNMKKVS